MPTITVDAVGDIQPRIYDLAKRIVFPHVYSQILFDMDGCGAKISIISVLISSNLSLLARSSTLHRGS